MITLRDEIIETFVEMQTKSDLRAWLPADSLTIYHNVADTAQAICSALGDDWNNPTCLSLVRLIARLIQKAHQWRTPLNDLDNCTASLGKKMDEALEQRSEGS